MIDEGGERRASVIEHRPVGKLTLFGVTENLGIEGNQAVVFVGNPRTFFGIEKEGPRFREPLAFKLLALGREGAAWEKD